MFIINKRIIWFLISAVLLGGLIWAITHYGVRYSIDFTGGTLTEIRYEGDYPAKSQVEGVLDSLNVGGYSVRPSGSDRYVIRTRELTQEEKSTLTSTLMSISSTRFTIERQTTIGPTAGGALQDKAVKAIGVVVVMIVLFITFAFRSVSKPVSSWKYGLATIVALAHDVIIPLGIFVYLGHEIDLLFVTGLLAILGYSVHDTIVVFDRVRENLKINQAENREEEFDITVGKSVNQTFARSINTSVTIFITLLALYLFGSPVTQNFSLLLIIGLIAGTYSSIFIASPLLVTFYKLSALARAGRDGQKKAEK